MKISNVYQLVDGFIAGQQHLHCHWDIPGACDGDCDCGLSEIQEAWKVLKQREVRYNYIVDGLRSLNGKVEELDEVMASSARIAEDTVLVGGFVSALDLVETAEEIVDRAIKLISCYEK